MYHLLDKVSDNIHDYIAVWALVVIWFILRKQTPIITLKIFAPDLTLFAEWFMFWLISVKITSSFFVSANLLLARDLSSTPFYETFIFDLAWSLPPRLSSSFILVSTATFELATISFALSLTLIWKTINQINQVADYLSMSLIWMHRFSLSSLIISLVLPTMRCSSWLLPIKSSIECEEWKV